MKIGVVVEGETEYYGLPAILAKVRSSCGNDFLGTLKADVHGEPSREQIALACTGPVKIQWGRGANLVLILLDFERRQGCPGQWAQDVAEQLQRRTGAQVLVVFKMRMFENWLVADPASVKGQPGRYKAMSKSDSAYVPGRADEVDALALLKKLAKGNAYDKVRDGKKLADTLELGRAAANSRSFRRFLRVCGHPKYSGQSRLAA